MTNNLVFPKTETPRSLGYRWPAEWEPHAATWLAWPHNRDTWPGAFELAVEQFVRFAKTIADFEPVHIIGSQEVLLDAQRELGSNENLFFHRIPTNDSWIRDYGPIFLSAKDSLSPPALLNWQYNAWGNKYPPFDLDNIVPNAISSQLNRRRFDIDLVLEGGSIDGNGDGVVLTTESCLLNDNRNPHMTKSQIEVFLKDYLVADNILWLNGDIPGDDTDGHVDQVARFANNDTILLANDSTNPSLHSNHEKIKRASDELQLALNVHELKLPSPKYFNQFRLPMSYANFYIINEAVILPIFNDPQDENAQSILKEVFEDREIIPLLADKLVVGLGAFHCLSQQQPA